MLPRRASQKNRTLGAPSRQGVVLFCCFTAILSGCGVEIGNPKKPTGTGQTTTSAFLLDDTSVASGLASSQADQVVATVAEESNTNSLGLTAQSLGLVGAPSEQDKPPAQGPEVGGSSSGSGFGGKNFDPSGLVSAPIDSDDLGGTTTSKCAVSGGTTVVQITSTGSVNKGFGPADHQGNYAASNRQEATTDTWQGKAAAVPCTTDGTDVRIDWTKADGMSLDQSINQSLASTMSRHGPQGNLSRSQQFQLNGARLATWALNSQTATAINLTKTVTGQLTQTLTTQRGDGSDLLLNTTIAVNSTAPIVVTVQRDPTSQAWHQKTVVSGTVITTEGSESRLEATYANLTFSVSGGCVPDSGQVSGTFFRGNEQAPYRSYVISFSQGVGSMTFDDGSTADYVPGYCDLDSASSTSSASFQGVGG